MGYDIGRFVEGTVDCDRLICSICMDVYDQPVELPECQHVFCLKCIKRWLQGKRECPLDRNPVKTTCVTLRAPNRTIRSLMEKLRIRCLFWDGGCREVFSLHQMEKHQRRCQHRKNSKHAKDEPDPEPAYRGIPGNDFHAGPGADQDQRHHAAADDQNISGILLTVILVVILVFTAFRR